MIKGSYGRTVQSNFVTTQNSRLFSLLRDFADLNCKTLGQGGRLIADLHLSPLSSRSDTPVFPHFFCSKLSANHHHSYYHFSGFLPNRSHRSIPPSLLPTHPVISVPTPADMPWKLPLQASQRGKYTREVDGIASDFHTPFLFQIQLSSLMDSSVEITCCRMFLKF